MLINKKDILTIKECLRILSTGGRNIDKKEWDIGLTALEVLLPHVIKDLEIIA